MPNTDLLRRTLAHIEDNRREWNQGTWGHRNECGTTYCFAGWAVVLSGGQINFEPEFDIDGSYLASYVVMPGDPVPDNVENAATRLLGLEYEDAARLFYAPSDLHTLRLIVAELTADEPKAEGADAEH